jgi:hypothetical protein
MQTKQDRDDRSSGIKRGAADLAPDTSTGHSIIEPTVTVCSSIRLQKKKDDSWSRPARGKTRCQSRPSRVAAESEPRRFCAGAFDLRAVHRRPSMNLEFRRAKSALAPADRRTPYHQKEKTPGERPGAFRQPSFTYDEPSGSGFAWASPLRRSRKHRPHWPICQPTD